MLHASKAKRACHAAQSSETDKAPAEFAVQDTLHWSHVLTSKINDQVKIVGATISCESSWLGGNKKSTVRHNPHVQSYFMATDQV